jgi:cytochrome c oxidase subunit 1
MLSKPHFILWLGMLVFALTGTFSDATSAIDIQLHDTYFVIFYSDLWAGVAIFLGVLGLIYWFLDWLGVNLWITLSFLHIFTTYLGSLGFIFFTRSSGIAGYPRRYYSFDDSYTLFLNNLPFIFISIFLLGQILFLINIIVGIIRKAFVNN